VAWLRWSADALNRLTDGIRRVGGLLALTALLSGGAVEAQETSPARLSFEGVGGGLANTGRLLFEDVRDVVLFPKDLDRAGWAKFGGAAAVTLALYAGDREIQDAVRRNRSGDLYDAWAELGEWAEPVGLMGNTNIYYIGFGAGSWLLGWDEGAQIAGELLFSHWISAALRKSLGGAVGRFRPEQEMGPRAFDSFEGTSFPSGHASTIVQVAYVLSHHIDVTLVDVALWTTAGAVVYQRVDSEKHWASDAVLGAIVGAAVANVVIDNHEPAAAVASIRPSLQIAPGVNGVEVGVRWVW